MVVAVAATVARQAARQEIQSIRGAIWVAFCDILLLESAHMTTSAPLHLAATASDGHFGDMRQSTDDS